MAVAQRPFTEAAFAAPSGPIAWKSVPSWYLLGTEDKAIPPATQRFMAERAGATTSIGHVTPTFSTAPCGQSAFSYGTYSSFDEYRLPGWSVAGCATS